MNSPSSAKSAMSSYLASTWSRVRPAARPPRTTFSWPVSSPLKPTPRASSVLTRPKTSTRPRLGGRMPAIVRRRVDFPAPLTPTTPSAVLWGMSKLTSRTALISRMIRSRRPRRMSVFFKVGFFSTAVRYVTERFSTLTAHGVGLGAGSSSVAAGFSEADRKLTLPRDEEEGAGDDGAHRPCEAGGQQSERRRPPFDHRVVERAQHRVHRVAVEDRAELLGHVLGVEEDRRRVEPDARQVREEVRQIAEVDLRGCGEHRRSRAEDRDERDDRDRPEERDLDRQPDGHVHDRVDREGRQEAHERLEHRLEGENEAWE